MDYAGEAQVYVGGSQVSDQTTKTWDYVRIVINEEHLDYYNISQSMRMKTVIHEFGHALSLRHQPKSAKSVMVQGETDSAYPQQLDKNNIAWKY